MKSMTGYALCETRHNDTSVSVEIRGYNSRFLEINASIPPRLLRFESDIRKLAGAWCARGKVELTIKIKDTAPAAGISINEEAATAWSQAIDKVSALLGGKTQVDAVSFLALEGVVETDKAANAGADAWEAVEPALTEAFRQFDEDRLREGTATLNNIRGLLTALDENLQTIRSHTEESESLIKRALRERFQEVLGSSVDENRVLTETAVLLVKFTIAEEVARLEAHLEEFRAALARENSGRKLEFLSQEINREINTITSKSQLLAINQAVVSMKEALENIREQLRNVE